MALQMAVILITFSLESGHDLGLYFVHRQIPLLEWNGNTFKSLYKKHNTVLDKKAYLPIVKPLFPLLNVRNN